MVHGTRKALTWITIVATLFGIAVSWVTLGLPRPIMYSEAHSMFTQVASKQEELRSIVLNDIRLRLKRELNDIEQQIWTQQQLDNKVPDWMIREKSDIEQHINEIDRQLHEMSAVDQF